MAERILLELLSLSGVGCAIMYLVRYYSGKGKTEGFYKWLWKEKFMKQEEYEGMLSPEQRQMLYREYMKQ